MLTCSLSPFFQQLYQTLSDFDIRFYMYEILKVSSRERLGNPRSQRKPSPKLLNPPRGTLRVGAGGRESEARLATNALLDRCPAVHVGWLLGLRGRWLWGALVSGSEREVTLSLRSRSRLIYLPGFLQDFGLRWDLRLEVALVARCRWGRGCAGARSGGQPGRGTEGTETLSQSIP